MDELKLYFKKIHNQLESGFTKAFQKYGLTSTQQDILLYLYWNANVKVTLTDIAAHFGVRHTSVIHVLKLLEKKDLICRSAAQGARSKPILLTESGAELCGRLDQEIKLKDPLLDEVMFAGLSENDRQHLEKMLRQIYRNLESDAFKNL